ncbi:aminoacyl-histidine dipeptidase [bacterium]|nr:aminoacyl-histidine dipeptidase [candidate division CSSED10-310 bacterium]
MSILNKLEPKPVWRHFEALTKIPHTSKNEAQVAAYVMEKARAEGLDVKRDAVGNVLVTKPATPGREKVPVMILQSHLDMVGVRATGSSHDFQKDPLEVKIEDGYVRAVGTTLGADNGIGVAFMLAIMESSDLEHGALEFLFTIDEEAGMTGAHGLDPNFVSGQRLLNLDTEEWGAYYISCAGGGDSIVRLPLEREGVKGGTYLELAIHGLLGGHSGADINLGHGSANKILGRFLNAARAAGSIRIAEISGGSKRNSIAAEARAVLWTGDNKAAVMTAMEAVGKVVAEELAKVDGGFRFSLTETDDVAMPPTVPAVTDAIIDLLVALPHGVQAMSTEVDGLVETSTNLGVIGIEGDKFVISMLNRSAVDSMIDVVKAQIRTIARLAGASVEEPRGYPGWKPNKDSFLLKKASAVYQEIHGREPVIRAIHAGLECGIFSKKLPHVDMLSLGPEIHGAHSIAEEVEIDSVEKTWVLVTGILAALKD